jgi:glyoxylase-like metal-dependent hydrolase (beta-lactamase superfamily II)
MPELIAYICATCGVQYPPSATPPAHCAICEDERQYVNAKGQSWITADELRATRQVDWRELEPGLFGMSATPQIAIGQRALIVPQPGGGVMWDCMPLVSDEAVAKVKSVGGVRAIAISHPHFFSAMAEWSVALDNTPIYLHEDLRPYVMRSSHNIRFWSGETFDLGQGITLIRCGGHFKGSTVLHWPEGADGKGALCTGDTIMVVADTRWMSFMRSFPNYIPLNRRAVEIIVAAVEPYAFDRLYALHWVGVCHEDAKARLRKSAERYIAAISD